MNPELQAKLDYYLDLAHHGKLKDEIVANSFWRLLGSLGAIAEYHSNWGIEEAVASALDWLELEHAVADTHEI